VDSKGKQYDYPVAVGCCVQSPDVTPVGLQCSLDDIPEKWLRGPLKAHRAGDREQRSRHEVVHQGKELDREGGGLDMIPVPISTPGFDNAPYTHLFPTGLPRTSKTGSETRGIIADS